MKPCYYFGRGSGACLGVEMQSGPYCRIFMGNGKTGERSEWMLLDKDQLYAMSEFFRALWQENGQWLQVKPISDDPHDELLDHQFDFSQAERLD